MSKSIDARLNALSKQVPECECEGKPLIFLSTQPNARMPHHCAQCGRERDVIVIIDPYGPPPSEDADAR